MSPKNMLSWFHQYEAAPKKQLKKGVEQPLSLIRFYQFLVEQKVYKQSWQHFQSVLADNKVAYARVMDYMTSVINQSLLEQGLVRNYNESLVRDMVWGIDAKSADKAVKIELVGISDDDLKR